MSDAVRVIKKYPNRRLYDTEISRYITLQEVRQLVLQNIEFKVHDKNSEEDITRSILLQVIAEEEEGGGQPFFSTELLTRIIRFYGDPMQASISRYLEMSIQLFVQKQHQFSDQLRQMLGQVQQPVQVLREMAEQNVPIWRTVRREFLRNLGRAKTTLRPRNRGERAAKSADTDGSK